jgi:hypothetical protein
LTFIRPRAISFNAWFSSSWSATIRFSFWFSFSSSFSRFASSAFKPPYCCRQRCSVCSDTSNCFATAATSWPSPKSLSASRNFLMICSGVCRRLLCPIVSIVLLAHRWAPA